MPFLNRNGIIIKTSKRHSHKMTMQLFIKSIYEFYRHDCCWPYAVSFFLALSIYYLDFFIVNTRYRWASLVAYGIILAYYLYNVSLYFQNKIKTKNIKFFAVFLSSKIIIWGLILTLLYAIKYCRGFVLR